jgi:hypothetical protein
MKKWEPDKWKHFYVGIVLGAALFASANYIFTFHAPILLLLSFVALVIICYGFELFSLVTGKGQYDLIDAIAGIIGGTIGIVISLLVSL